MSFSLNHIEHIYFCTGARNEKLLSFFPSDKVTFEIDERLASFKALGRAKALNKPVAVCTTSGTAVSECLSALIEAQYSNIPLILISGDRPKKLHGTGSPQTIDHKKITNILEKNFFEFPIDEFRSFEWNEFSGPVHLNILIDDTISHEEFSKIEYEFSSFKSFLKDKKNPLFIFSHEQKSMRDFIEKFKSLNIPFYAESLSGGRDLSSISTDRELSELLKTSDSVIRVGHTPLSKIWRLLEKKPLPVFSFDNRSLPGLSFGSVMGLSSKDLIENSEFWDCLKKHHFEYLQRSSQERTLFDLLSKYSQSEPTLLSQIQEEIPFGANIYLGNSLVIRFFELTQRKSFNIFGNRGVNGIDGQLSSAIGIAEGLKAPLFCILGDITAKYDLSAFQDLPKNLKLIIVNNKGGRIFEMLKLDPRIILTHESNFSNISSAFNLSYSNKLSDLNTHQVLELFPNQEQTREFLGEWEK